MANKKRRTNTKQLKQLLGIIVFVIFITISFFFSNYIYNEESNNEVQQAYTNININSIPKYTGSIYININNNVPYFNENEYTTNAFEQYSELDEYGRCGVAYANICKEIMPTKTREDISNVKPTGWIQKKYNGEYLYNRCHLIGHQLAGEDANKLNLITGTKYLNVVGMLPFENKVAEYIKNNKNNHVLYRVTPIFKEDNLLANGVQIEACSVEDKGKGICFNVYIYNVQPGISINYKTGESFENK